MTKKRNALQRCITRLHHTETCTIKKMEAKLNRHRFVLTLVTIGVLVSTVVPQFIDMHPLHIAGVAALTNLIWIWGTA